MQKEVRLDIFIKDKFNFSREYSKEIILKKYVKIDGKIIDKPSFKVCDNNFIEIDEKSIPKYVSRGGLKIEKALNYFNICLNDKICLDIGASTGGFTDCMLKNGAKKVYAVDVGNNQLNEILLNDKRVISMENTDIRNINHLPDKIDFISIDVSFISLTKIIQNLHNLLEDGSQIIALIKPQFEVGRDNLEKNGVVKNKKIHKSILQNLYRFFLNENFEINGITYSPIKGGKGNIEYLISLIKKQQLNHNFELNTSKIVEDAFNYLK